MSRVEILVTWGLLIIVALGVASVSRHLSQIEYKLEELSAYATKLAEAFSAKVSKEMYASSLFDTIVNRDYDGDIMDVGSVLNILSFSKLSEKDYSGANLSVDDLNESNGQLVIDKQKSFYFKVKTIDKFKSYIKDPKSTINEQAFNERKKNVDIYVLGKYAQVAAGHCKFCQTMKSCLPVASGQTRRSSTTSV